MCLARADLLSISSGRAKLLEQGTKQDMEKPISHTMEKPISHTEELCLACPLRIEELCICLLVDCLLACVLFFLTYNKRFYICGMIHDIVLVNQRYTGVAYWSRWDNTQYYR